MILTTLKFSRVVLLLITVIGLYACNTRYQAPVADSGDGMFFQSDGRTHRVNTGETLYSIAWVYDLDYAKLAQLNSLADPYQIFTGQLLNIDMRSAPKTNSLTSTGPPVTYTEATSFPASNASSTSSTTIATSPVRLSVPIIRRPSPRPRVSIATPPTIQVETPKTRTTPAPLDVPSQVIAPVINTGKNNVDSQFLDWSWPTMGKVIHTFSNTGAENKGIDIAGIEGDSIHATEAGEIVYAGSGLLRYGDLVIIKHNDEFLSAYAHNSQLTVQEGEWVTRGQKIAELGSTGITEDMLHFEIRLAGEPVDPLKYLPSQQE